MSIEASALPPLDSTHSTKLPDLESSNSSPESEYAPQEIKRNILQIYPRLQSIEKDIKNIRQQLPSELNRNILQVRRDVFDLKEKSGNQTKNINDALSQLKNLENQMNFKVDSCVDDFLSDFKKKFFTDIPKQKNTGLQLSSNSQDEFDKNLDGITSIFSQYSKSTEQRLSYLEQKIAKLASQSTRLQSADNIEKMRKLVQQQNIQLSEINANLSSLIQSSQEKSAISFQAPHSGISYKNDVVISTSKKDIADLSDPMRVLSEQIKAFQKEFTNSLTNAREKMTNCRNRLAEVKDMANEIQESATEIESKVIEVNNLCDSLSLQIKEMAHNLSQNTAQRTIDSISVQIKSVQDRIISELNSIKKRLKKCEMSEPLIDTNSSKSQNNDIKKKTSNYDDDVYIPLPTVTFGEIKK